MLTPFICSEIEKRYLSMLEAVKAGDFERFAMLQNEVTQLRRSAEQHPQEEDLDLGQVAELRIKLPRILELDREISEYLLTLHEETRRMLHLEKRHHAVRSTYESPGF